MHLRVTSPRALVCLLLAPFAFAVAPPAVFAASSPVAHLMLPHFEVDTGAADGTSTLWAIRNDGFDPLTLTVTYYETDRVTPQHTEVIELEAKQVRTRNLRDLVGQLQADDDGTARGWVDFQGDGAMTGDYFFVTPGEAFATGDRLIDIDSGSPDYELCSNWVIRFLNGGGFSGGTTLTFWLDLDTVPTGEDPVAFYIVYDEAGEVVLANSLFAEQRTFRVPASQLVTVGPIGADFGALEIQFSEGILGHVSGVMDALGVFSVGFSATCRD